MSTLSLNTFWMCGKQQIAICLNIVFRPFPSCPSCVFECTPNALYSIESLLWSVKYNNSSEHTMCGLFLSQKQSMPMKCSSLLMNPASKSLVDGRHRKQYFEKALPKHQQMTVSCMFDVVKMCRLLYNTI